MSAEAIAGTSYPMAQKQLRALDTVDKMPGDLRRCVHEFGFPIVQAMLRAGVKNPAHIRDLVREVWSGARQHGQGNDARQSVDVLLSQGILSTASLAAFLAANNLAIVTVEPTRAMIAASMAEVANFDVRVTKEEKHRRRLRAALRVGMADMLKREAHQS